MGFSVFGSKTDRIPISMQVMGKGYVSGVEYGQVLSTIPSSPPKSLEVTIRISNGNTDLPGVSSFLAEQMYGADLPDGQRRELGRLELSDLKRRYSKRRAGKTTEPSCLIVAEEEGFIVGCVGMDVQQMDRERRKLSTADKSFSDGTEETTLVLANLVIRRERRGKGLAKALVRACEDVAIGWGYESISLLVDSANTPALKLYTKLGFKRIFEDDQATCVLPGEYNLRTVDCINYCMQKQLGKKSSVGGLFGLFGR